MQKKWKKIRRNEILEGKDFYISYNPNTSTGAGVFFTDLANTLGAFTNQTFKDGKETALCHKGEFFILVGDYRKEYEKIISKSFKDAKNLFDSLIIKGAKVSTWSD